MAYDFQVVIDSHDPHVLAEWWAEAIGWVIEPTDEDFIRKMIAEGYAREEDTITHRGALVWREGAAIRHPDGLDSGIGKRILFQLVPEPKTVKNRLHWDLRGNVDEFVERGATHRWDRPGWTAMADPEGNEFCVLPEE